MRDTCRRIDELLNDAFDREWSAEERHLIDEHRTTCPACAAAYEAVRIARETLREERTVKHPFPVDLRESLHRRLVEEAMTLRPGRSLIGRFWRPLAAVAALFCLAVGAALLAPTLFPPSDEGTIVSRTVVDAQEPLTVRLTYTAERPLADVRVTIELDEGISFFTDDPSLRSLRTYTWRGDLKPGPNEIPFVVEVTGLGTRRIRTSARYDGELHRHDVVLDADREKVAVIYLSYRERPL